MQHYPYKKPQQLAENLWELSGSWSNAFGRRMTVVRLPEGRLFIHNAFQLESNELEWLKNLGTPSYIVAPNTFHCSDAAWVAEQFPKAELFVPASKMSEFSSRGLRPKDNFDFPEISQLASIPMLGARMEEVAFVHIPSKTLILCDLAFNMPQDSFDGLERVFMRWNKIEGRFGPSRLTKLFFTLNKKQLLSSYAKLLQFEFERVIVNHGDILESGGRERLRASVKEIFGTFPDED